ncbi:hypothetical protein [Limobrevibacterium gyesilva]|uniref:Uncharacterized protein n=1 Tax=Limobrevibacterium gyesilva TaxID=2991712 RepID=A0AA41YL44_9PROT|nr:hypothetical protein [Limobrevibacterium gyesilva]MCW3474630.1 hypothetical protein [Limobrevibacterium gyesilva]
MQVVFRGHEQAGFFVHAMTLGRNFDLLRVAPGNKPPADEPYACVIAVRDYWRMHPGHCERQGVPHFSASVEPAILEDVRAGRALLLFDLTNEGPGLNVEIFDHLHAFLDRNGIDASRAVWLAQNRNMEAAYRAQYADKRSSLFTFEYYDFFVKVMAFNFSPKAPSPVFGAAPDDYIAKVYDQAAKDRVLLCLNATPRPHRVLTIAGLLHHGLFDDSLVSFPGLAYAKDASSADAVMAYAAASPAYAHLRHSCVAAMALKDLRVDDFNEKGNQLFDKIDVKPYERTYFSIVTETEATNGNVSRITEKAAKAFCLGHPAFIVGNPRSSRFMTELGFQAYPGVIDADYEDVTDPGERFNLMFRRVRRQVRAVKELPAAWLNRVRGPGEANIRHAASGGFLQAYVDRYDRPVAERLARMLAQ